MKLSSRCLLPFMMAPLLFAEVSVEPQHLPLYKALCSGNEKTATTAMEEAQGEYRFNNAFFELCGAAINQGDVNFFAKMAAVYLDEICGPLDSPFAKVDGHPKSTYYFAAPLLHAAAAGKTEIVRVLLLRGANRDEAEYYDRTAIVYAAANGHLPCVKLLHQAGVGKADIALQAALHFKQKHVAEYLQSHGVRLPAVGDVSLSLAHRTPTGETVLMQAVQSGSMEHAAYVMENAPHWVNCQNSYGRTALMMARDAEMARLLLDYGADASIKDDLGCTALDAAYQSSCPGVVAVLQEADAPAAQPFVGLCYACSYGDAELAHSILAVGGVDVNGRSKSGKSLLVLAVQAKSADVVDLLLKNGASIKGSGALRCAVQTDQPHFVRMFMDHEHLCPPSPRSPRGGFSSQEKLNALLHAACRENAPQTVKMLLEMGAEVNDTRMTSYGHFATGNTPLHEAARGPMESILLLLDAGANINARNQAGDTPLMLALQFTGAEPVSIPEENALFLLERGADATLKNNAGENAADVAWAVPHIQALARAGVQKTPFAHPLADAVFAKDVEKVRELLAEGANPDMPLRSGSTLLQVLAASSIHDDAVENEMFRLLVQNGAQLDEEVFLHLCGWGNTDMMQAMLDAGVSIQPRGMATYKYLHSALHGAQPHFALPLLLQAGADINAEDERGYTLLLNMAMSDYFVNCNLAELLEHRPNLEITVQGSTAEWNGLTALGVALRTGKPEMAYQLLLAGANATAPQVQAIFFHVLREHPEHAAVLLARYGASPTEPEPSTGLTPMDIATRSGNAELVSILHSAINN